MHRLRFGRLTLLIALALLTLGTVGPVHAQSEIPTVLRAAYVPTGTGLVGDEAQRPALERPIDLRFLAAIAERADFAVTVAAMGRVSAERALANGTVDLVLPSLDASPSASMPYRAERMVLLCARGLPALGAKGTAAIEEAYARGWRLVFLRDVLYRADIAAVPATASTGQAIRVGNIDRALVAIMEGEAQCIAAPRLALLAAYAAMPKAESSIALGAVDLGATELRLAFSPTLAPGAVDAFQSAIAHMRQDGTTEALEVAASRPALLRFAVTAPWFGWLDVIGTVAFALSGVLIARAENFSFLGAFVLAGLPAVGGGVMRDLLVGREPIGILASAMPLTLVIGTVLVAYPVLAMAGRAMASDSPSRLRLPKALSPLMVLEVTDALGLAAFTVFGVSVAVRYDTEPLWLWGPFLAGLSGAGGGILRDLLRTGYENPALRTSFYAEVCVIWGLALTLAIVFLLPHDSPILIRIAVALTVIGAFVTRLVVVAAGLRSPRF